MLIEILICVDNEPPIHLQEKAELIKNLEKFREII